MDGHIPAPDGPLFSTSHPHPRPSRRLSSQHRNSSSRPNLAPTNPEVISNLISSLSIISTPAASNFDSVSPASTSRNPTSPNRNYIDSPTLAAKDHCRHLLHDFAPASASNDPTSYPLSLTNSSRAASKDRASGSRSNIRGSNISRASSRASIDSGNDDTRSIGNLSIEPGSAPDLELKPRQSHDSWGKKSVRRQKEMMYMSSKERLRDKDFDRKWASGAPGNSCASSIYGVGRTDSFLVETAINEEPGYSYGRFSSDSYHGLQAIPARESSLKNAGQKKRSSARRSRQDGDLTAMSAPTDNSRSRAASRTSHKRGESDVGRSFLFDVDEYAAVTRALDDEYEAENGREPRPTYQGRSFIIDDIDCEGAPSPAISNGRRAYERKQENSRRLSPFPNADSSIQRTNLRLKRSSGSHMSPPRTSEQSERQSHPITYERPASADSIDNAVESYLCSPRLSQRITHPQTGRVISFSQVGDPEGSAVFCCVGMGLTRYITTFYDELALTLKLRLITPDRPGVGDSEPYADDNTTPLNWPDDIYAICQALKITKFSILAHSAGAIYALATALRMPQHIRGKIHMLAPWIPPSQMSSFGTSSQAPPTHAIPTSQRILRALPTPILKAANSSFMSATSSSISSSLPKNSRRNKRKGSGKDKDNRNAAPADKVIGDLSALNGKNGELPVPIPDATENMDRMHPPKSSMYAGPVDAVVDKERQTTYDTRLTHAIWDLATTRANPAVDLLVCLERRQAIGFRYVDITRPVVIHHGSKDNRVPVENVKWLGRSMRRCEVRVLEGEGHGLMASATVMGSVLMEMSKEWEDWIRVTGDDSRHRERGRRLSLR